MRVCLIGVAHPCHNPRLTREADSLVEAGHDVRVVAPSIMDELAQADHRLMATRSWRLQSADFRPVGLAGKYRALLVRGKRRLASEVFEKLGGELLAETSYTTALSQLKRLASREPADWFIAHTQAALPVAVTAAKKFGARVGFDCEDLLSETGGRSSTVVRLLENRYLPFCDYVSTPSEEIAKHLSDEYNVAPPLVLYNVCHTRLAAKMNPPVARLASDTLRVHWFSQTIGPGRGIEEAIEAVGLLRGKTELHLRGCVSESFRAHLEALASEKQVRLLFLPLIDHDRLIESMESFDVGLALERMENRAYALTAANKIFTYLLAGLAVAASDTPGQREVMSAAPGTGFLYPTGKPDSLSAGLQRWLKNRDELNQVKQAAWNRARTRFCWDLEQARFLDQLVNTLQYANREASAA